MATVTFDTLEFVKTLESAGMPVKQAEAISIAVRKAYESIDVATKGDIALLRSELALHRWMLGFVLAGMISLLVKTFF